MNLSLNPNQRGFAGAVPDVQWTSGPANAPPGMAGQDCCYSDVSGGGS